LERLEVGRSLRSGADLARREVLERWRGSKAQVWRGCFAARTTAGRRGSVARDAQIPGEQSGKRRIEGCWPGLLALTRHFRAPDLGFHKEDQQRCGGGVPRQRRDESGPTLLPRPSTHAAVLSICVSSSKRTHLIVPFYLDLERKSTFIHRPTALPCDMLADYTSNCYIRCAPRSISCSGILEHPRTGRTAKLESKVHRRTTATHQPFLILASRARPPSRRAR
jgi:hypothetical protein